MLGLNRKKYYRVFFEILLILILVFLSVLISENSLRNWKGPGGSITTDLYIPSIMFASGKGFINVNPKEVPHLREFLDFNEQTFLPEYVPSDIHLQNLDIYQQYHRYLIYTVGIIWRIFGISWEVLRWFLVFFYTVTVLLVYAIARVFLFSFFSFLVGYFFSTSLIPVTILPILRDFARAPFILAVLLILFYLVQSKKTFLRFTLCSFLIGLTCGIGIGFRRDLLMFLPLSLFILLLLPKTDNVPKIPVRVFGIVIALTTFFITAYPILQSFQKYGTLGWHDALMGFGTEHDDLAGLQRTNYERIPKYNDLLVSVTADAHSYYTEPLNDYELFIKRAPELEKKKLFFAYLYYFPADFLIRIYTSIARLTDRILTSAMPINPYRALLGIGIIILFLSIDFHKGLCFAVILLYTLSIQTLQFNFRHHFYLSFVPHLLHCLFIQFLLIGIYCLLKDGKENIYENMEPLRRIVIRFVIISFTVAFFAYGILIALRQIQSYQLTKLFSAYHSAELVPIEFTPYQDKEGTIYTLNKPLSLQFDEPMMAQPSFATNILVVDFFVQQFPACFKVVYDGTDDFSCNLPIIRSDSATKEPTYVRFFIPIYENMQTLKSAWNRFIGIQVENLNNIQLQNIYKVCNLDKIPLLINYYFVKDELPDLYQRIANYSTSHINPCWEPYGFSSKQVTINEANGAYSSGNKEKAYEILTKSMEEEPYLLTYGLELADLYEQSNEHEKAKEILIHLLSKHPHDPIPGTKLEGFLNRINLSSEEKQTIWKNILSQLPDSSIVWFYYATNLTNDNESKETLSKATNLNREILLSTPFVSTHYEPKEIFSQAMKSEPNPDNTLCSNISTRRQISFILTSGIYLNRINNFQKSVDVLQYLANIKPDLYLLYPPIISSSLKLQNTDLEKVFYYSNTLISLIPYKLEPIIQMEEIQENIQYFSEQEWIELWLELKNKFPDSPCILCGLGRAYELNEQKPVAKSTYENAIYYARKSQDCAQLAYYRLAKLLYSSTQIEHALILLKKAIKLYPNNQTLQNLFEEYNTPNLQKGQ